MSKSKWIVVGLLLVSLIAMAGCGPAEVDTAEEEARIADLEAQLAEARAQAEEGGEVDEAALADLEAELEAAQAELEAAQAAAEAGDMESFSVDFKNPGTFVNMTIGDVDTLDPAVMYDSASGHIGRQIYDTLIFPKGESVDEYVPMLASDWSVSDDGLTYTFTIREGVTFHEGGTLEPHDVAYTFARNMLLGWDSFFGGPMGLYFDPIFGAEGIGDEGDGGVFDMAGGDDVAVCEMIKSAVVADDDAGTVTMTLNYPAGYFPQLLGNNWASILDSEWMIENGAWDGDCTTWRDWYTPETADTLLYNRANGTGPYKLESWTPGDELVLVANENWWVTEPLWEGSTIDGAPDTITTYVYKIVPEWGTRFAAFQAGDADLIWVPIPFANEIDPMVADLVAYSEDVPFEPNPGGIFRLYWGVPDPGAADFFLNQEVNIEGGNPLVGSGELDGNGVPADFFKDVHVRKGFAYCFDYDTYIDEVLLGEGIRHRGAIISGMLGYEEDSPVYEYDLEKCAEELALAYDGALMENGMNIQLIYNLGNDSRRISAEILRDGLQAVDENGNFIISVTSLPWPAYLAANREGRIPAYRIGWGADFIHPHNFVVPYMSCNGNYSGAQGLDPEVCGAWDDIIYAAVRELDPEKAHEMYAQLQTEGMDYALDIFITQPIGRNYQQLWIEGWYANPLVSTTVSQPTYLASMDKVAP